MSAADDEPSTLQARLEVDDAVAPDTSPTVADPVALLRHLEVSGRFHRDSRAGRMYHPGMVSLREDVPTDSLHVSVDDNRVMAHVDEASPLAVRSDGPSRYSLPRMLAHNGAGMASDLLSLLRGRQGDHRCELDCEWVCGQAGVAPRAARLLDPATSAWGVQLDARVAGSIDEPRLRAALDAIVGVDGAGAACLTSLDCGNDEDLDLARRRLHGVGIPLTVVPPLHVYLAHHPDGDVLMFNLNHAAVDGFGALHVLDSIARAYSGAGQPPPRLDFLACADLPVRPTSPTPSWPGRLGRMSVERLRDTLSKPPRLAGDEGGGGTGYGFHFVEMAGQPNRDTLVAALHLAVAEWNAQRAMAGRRIGVLVPVDLRPAQLPAHVIANLSVNTRLSTTRRERATPAAALRAIGWQGRRDTGKRTGIALIAALQRAGMLALWAKQSSVVLQPLTGNRAADAAMLCDLGPVARTPSFGPDAGELRELWFSPPSRSPRCLCVGAVTVGERLHLTFRHPHAILGPAGARRFAELYVAQLERVGASSA